MAKPITINERHPALPGHFPGRPIVPGVVILGQVRAQMAAEHPECVPKGIKKLKFLRLLKPGEKFNIHFEPVKNDGIRFKCLMVEDSSILADGHFSLES